MNKLLMIVALVAALGSVAAYGLTTRSAESCCPCCEPGCACCTSDHCPCTASGCAPDGTCCAVRAEDKIACCHDGICNVCCDICTDCCVDGWCLCCDQPCDWDCCQNAKAAPASAKKSCCGK